MANVIRFGGFAALPKSNAGLERETEAADARSPTRPLLGGSVPWGDQSKYSREELDLGPPQQRDLDALSPEDFAFERNYWIATSWAGRNPVPSDDELPGFDISALDDEFRRDYAAGAWRETRGATAEEIWITEQLKFQRPFIWLINREQQPQPLDRVAHKRFFAAVDLVFLLGAACVQLQIDESAFPVATFDGETGHVIYLAGLNPIDYPHPAGVDVRRGWFSFHDPWPARSLLAAGRNRARVAALEDYPRAPNWLISPEELARVIYGTWLALEDFEQELTGLAETVRAIEGDRRGGGRIYPQPPWADDGGPFAVFIGLAGGRTGCETVWALGAGRLRVEAGEFDVADEFFELAVAAGGPDAARHAASILERHGYEEQTRHWLKRAAEQGDGKAARSLGLRLYNDDRTDPGGEALRWLELAAEQGDAEAANVAGILRLNRGDRKQAADWWERAAEGGEMDGATRLGLLLLEDGADETGEAWLERAVAAGEVPGATVLAGCYYDRGEKARAREILEWARDHGAEDAESFLQILDFD